MQVRTIITSRINPENKDLVINQDGSVNTSTSTPAISEAPATSESGTLTWGQLLRGILSRLPSSLVNNRLQVESLGLALVARTIVPTGTSANTILTTTATRMSMFAVGGAIRYSIGSASQTATQTSHYIGSGERIDIDLPATPNIGVILATGSTATSLEITELS